MYTDWNTVIELIKGIHHEINLRNVPRKGCQVTCLNMMPSE